MADEPKVPDNETPNSPETPKKEAPLNEDKGFVEGKYKTPQELEKAYRDLESRFGEQGKELGEAREFQAVMAPIVELAKNDEEVFKILDKKLRKVEDAPQKDKAQANEELKTVASDLLLARFEEKHGIDKLSKDDQAKLRKEIGSQVTEMTGQPYSQIDLRRLSSVLEKAYLLAKPSQKSETQDDDDASIGSLPTSPGKAETTLSSEEATVASKLGLTREQYLAGRKSQTKK